jgi:hypothetical protein
MRFNPSAAEQRMWLAPSASKLGWEARRQVVAGK